MRILVVTNLYPPDVIGGYELACQEMVAELRLRNHEVRVLTSCTRASSCAESGVARRLRFVFRHSGWPVRGNTGSAEVLHDLDAQIGDGTGWAHVAHEIMVFRPDVVYLWNLSGVGGLGIVLALAELQVPVVWQLMDNVPGQMAIADGRLSSALLRIISERLRGLFVLCSQGLWNEIEESGFEIGEKGRLIPNWVEERSLVAERQWFAPGAGPLRLVSAGQLAPHKGFDHIVEGMRLLKMAGYREITADIYGAGMEEHYRRLILSAHLSSSIRLMGAVEKRMLVGRYREYDMFLFPTWSREPFGFAPLEAAASGCVPAVSTRCGCGEWMVSGVDCLKMEPSAEGVAKVVESALRGAVDLREVGLRARRSIRELFSLKRIADRIEQVLEECAGSFDVTEVGCERAQRVGRALYYVIGNALM